MRQDRHLHPLVREAHGLLQTGAMDRREFIRTAALLGTSAVTATALAGCGQPGETRKPAATIPSSPRRGGELRVGSAVQRVDHPARISWVEGANQLRQVAEHLTETGVDNITRPWLLESWEANDAVDLWTLNLRRGILFNNGDELQADDVIFNFAQWLDPDVGSSMLGLMSYLDLGNVEKMDDYTVRLHLSQPQIAVPEHLYHYPGMILHRGFEGDFIKQPVGTGPFTLVEYAETERTVLQRREGYWKAGADGQALPYLERIVYLDLDPDTRVAAMQAGQIDTIYQPRPADWQALKDVPGVSARAVSTAQTFVLRMRVDLPPWNDVRVRTALKLCQDREKILQLAYFGQGDLGPDAHVAPIHPAFCEKPWPRYDPRRARQLLTAAGYPDGLQVTLSTKNDMAEPEIAQALKELAAPGGFDIRLDITEPSSYWERWTEVDLGITAWTHRPLGTMVLALAYTSDDDGNPVPWNETRWVDSEFDDLLRQAEGTLDNEARRRIMCRIEEVMQERGPIGIPFWRKVWNITRAEFQNVHPHPTSYDLLYDVWKNT